MSPHMWTQQLIAQDWLTSCSVTIRTVFICPGVSLCRSSVSISTALTPSVVQLNSSSICLPSIFTDVLFLSYCLMNDYSSAALRPFSKSSPTCWLPLPLSLSLSFAVSFILPKVIHGNPSVARQSTLATNLTVVNLLEFLFGPPDGRTD